jgi:hypothetical protein
MVVRLPETTAAIYEFSGGYGALPVASRPPATPARTSIHHAPPVGESMPLRHLQGAIKGTRPPNFYTCRYTLDAPSGLGGRVHEYRASPNTLHLGPSTNSISTASLASAYSAVEAEVRSFAHTWTTVLKARRIRVNAISPGPIDAEGLRQLPGSGEAGQDRLTSLRSVAPMGRMGNPDEIAKAVVFPASDDRRPWLRDLLVVRRVSSAPTRLDCGTQGRPTRRESVSFVRRYTVSGSPSFHLE